MARIARPWYRRANDTWYVCLRGQQVPLCRGRRNRTEAQHKYDELRQLNDLAATRDASPVRALLEEYLQAVAETHQSRTIEDYRYTLQSFVDLYGDVPVHDLIPMDVERWVRRHPAWGESMRWKGKTILSAAFNWGVKNGILSKNPVKGVAKGRVKSRGPDCIIDMPTHEKLLAAADPCLKSVLICLRRTGCRPSELCRVTAGDFSEEQGTWTLSKHKTDAHGGPRVIALDAEVVRISRELSARHPEGPIFRNSRGTPYTAKKLTIRLWQLRERLGIAKAFAYGYRHTFCTRLLEQGVPEAHVAALAGHKGTNMIHKHYNHITSRMQAVRAALSKLPTSENESRAV